MVVVLPGFLKGYMRSSGPADTIPGTELIVSSPSWPLLPFSLVPIGPEETLSE